MTFLQLRQLVSGWVDDKDNGYFTVADVNQYINNAQQEVQKILIQAFEDLWVKCVETTLVPFQIEYQLPTDFKKLNSLEVVVNGYGNVQTESVTGLQKITRNQKYGIVGVNYGTPQFYYFQNNKLILQPAPDTARVLRLGYTYRIEDLVNDGDEPDIPSEYHEFIAVLATITCLTRDSRDASTFIEKRNYYEQQLKRDAEQRNIDSPRTIVQTMSDDSDFIF